MEEKTKTFLEAARALALALKDPDTSPIDGDRIAHAFIDAFDAMEGTDVIVGLA